MTRRIMVGGVAIGGGAPVTVQSMCNVSTADARKVIRQIDALTEAGCDLVRIAVPDMDAVRAIGKIKESISIPLIADIHFDHRLALESLEAGIDKIRINPGNIGSREHVAAVARACRRKAVPIRIGVNGGSLEKALLEKYGTLCPEALAQSALAQAQLLQSYDLEDICISVKPSSVPMTVAAYKLISQRSDLPLHVGVTEAGGTYDGLVKSSAGIGALLLDGVGDTVRVSLTADPVEEVKAAIAILKAVGLRKGGVDIISCPTCGRTKIDLFRLRQEVQEGLCGIKADITVAVMGCVVNGPGEASAADYGIAGGNGEGVIFAGGKVIEKAPQDKLVPRLLEIIRKDINE